MEVILARDIENLGFRDEVVTVKDGYARNYLIPKRLAICASQSNRKQRDEVLKQREHREKERVNQARETAAALENLVLNIPAKVGANGKLFGSITHADLADALRKSGCDIDKRCIEIKSGIVKATGTYTASIRLHRLVTKDFRFEVVAD
ncbi:MAG: 50S ribosomal protein L9 [Flavobacteriales bacterium]